MPLDVSRIRAVLFDLDGTLADTDDQYIDKALRWVKPIRFLFPRRDPRPFLRWAIMTAEAPLNLVLAVPDWLGVDDELVAGLNWLSDHVGRRAPEQFWLMPGVRELLPALQTRFALALVTARSARSTQDFLTEFDLTVHFTTVASAQTADHTKPYPDPVIWVARRLGVPTEYCLMVGDTVVDVLAGKRAGAQTVGLLCGLGERAELERAGADLILEKTGDLAALLLA